MFSQTQSRQPPCIYFSRLHSAEYPLAEDPGLPQVGHISGRGGGARHVGIKLGGGVGSSPALCPRGEVTRSCQTNHKPPQGVSEAAPAPQPGRQAAVPEPSRALWPPQQ